MTNGTNGVTSVTNGATDGGGGGGGGGGGSDGGGSDGGGADGGATITLYEHIRRTHEKAVTDAAGLATAWDGLEGRMDVERFKGVQVRDEERRGEVRRERSHCSACVHGVCVRESGSKACRYMYEIHV